MPATRKKKKRHRAVGRKPVPPGPKKKAKTRHQQKLAKLIKQGELAHGEPMPSDVLRSMTLQEQYVSSVDEFKQEVGDRRSGLVPWHRLPFEVVQEAHGNKQAIAKLVKNRAIRPRDKDIDEKTAKELKQLRWVKEKHPFYDKHGFDVFAESGAATQDHAPIPSKLFELCTHYMFDDLKGVTLAAPSRSTFLLNREEACVLRSNVPEWEEITAFLDRQHLRFEMYWKTKTLDDFLESVGGNYGLDNNMHWIKCASVERKHLCEEVSIYFASFYLDRCHRYSICILLPIENVLSRHTDGSIVQREDNPFAPQTDIVKERKEVPGKNFHSARIIGPPLYYCYTCLCDKFEQRSKGK